jgi:SAM-dependent methyltransferase
VTEYVGCNLCGCDDTEPLFRLRDYRFRVDEVEWTAVRCRSCGLAYLNPRPTPDEIPRYYPPSYFATRNLEADRYAKQARYVRRSDGRLLDVGTAKGDFLAVMAQRGWEVTGIEPSSEAGNPHALTIYRERFPDECSLPDESFDVITAWAVFEHLHDPAAAFRICARLLRPGGRLILQVPNLRSIQSRWAMQEDVPRHLYFFSVRTLCAYGITAGIPLRRVVQTTNLFGGSGRGVLRLLLMRAFGKSLDDFFEVWQTPRRERFRRWPALTVVWTGASAIERVLLADWIVRLARMSGQIVAEFERPLSKADCHAKPFEPA